MSVPLRLSAFGVASTIALLVLSGCSSPIPGGNPLPSNSSAPIFPAGQATSVTGDAGSGSSGGTGSTGGTGSSGGSGGNTGGFTMNPDCMGVLSAYSTIALALLPSLTGGGQGTYDAGQVASAISGLGGQVPIALKGDFATLGNAAKAASGKSLTEAGTILGAPAVSAASDDITKWTDANCG